MKEVKVFAPATVANVACGFDILGFAIEKPGDEVVARFANRKGLAITQITGTQGKKLPFEVEKNTAGYAALQLLKYLGEENKGIELEIHKKMPFGSGLGSSAASSVGGVMAVNELLDCPLTKSEILRFAVEGEEIADGAFHADNVAPSLFGGITLIRNNKDLDVHALPVPNNLYAIVVHPKIEILTKDARAVLSEKVSLKKCIEQSGNLGGLIVGLYNADMELISRSLEDVIIEPQRAVLIPQFQKVKSSAMNAGALGCSISGAGPSIFALCDNFSNVERIGIAMQKVFSDNKIQSECFSSPINQKGAIRLS
ncbi:MAG: homoserine kinase [Bacteroidota bacterium]